jgi:lipopolysaccharide assembly outer membrane protein LptD (OstA)
MKLSRLNCLLVLWLGASLCLQAAEEEERIEIEAVNPGQVDFDYGTGIATLTDFVVRYKGAVLTAQRGRLNEKTGDVLAEGSVILESENAIWRGERLQYNFLSKQLQAGQFRTGRAPFFAAGQGLGVDQTNRVYVVTNAFVTTDDVEQPGYRVRASRLTIVPGKYFEARHAVLYFGKVPVFYFPYYRRQLDPNANYFVVTPGFRSVYGPYLLGAYHWHWNEKLYGAINLDYRVKRGLGGGPDLNYDIGKLGHGEFKYYYARDEEPGFEPTTLASTNSVPIREHRHRINFTHQVNIRSNLTARAVVREQSDAFFIRDFFESEYRENTQPSSFVEVNQLWSNFSLNALGQYQINDFFETIERLPDVKLTGLRQQLGISPFYYESDSSFGYFRHKFANGVSNDFAAVRGDSFHQLLLPQTFFGWLNVTPRVGGRFTYYGETEGAGTTLTEKQRWVFNTGAEVSFKASRLWTGAHSKLLEVDGLRHIIQPSLNYVYVPTPNQRPPELPQFDSELSSLRLLPIDFPDYNSIDSVDSQNVLRLGLRNKLQTKREDGAENLVNWAVYTDWRIKPRTDQETFSDIYSDLDFKPRSWITLTSETRFDVKNHRWNEANHVLTLTPNSTWGVSLGHRYLREDPALGPDSGNSLIYTALYYRLNEDWGFRASQRYEARDGTLEEQQYTIYRDFRSWTGALSFRIRDNRVGPTDYGVAVTFSLKAVPRYKLGDDRNKPSLLLGS